MATRTKVCFWLTLSCCLLFALAVSSVSAAERVFKIGGLAALPAGIRTIDASRRERGRR